MTQSQVEAVIEPFTVEGKPLKDARPLVIADSDQLQQVCINLCVNAIQAMPDGGRLRVGTHALVRRRPGLESAAAHRYVVLEVEDTGVGIPPDDRERIFEPFYSTKSPAGGDGRQGGTGLGLAICRRLANALGGRITLQSNLGQGSTFTLAIPVEAEQ
jgi:signal transduction histidine kinase